MSRTYAPGATPLGDGRCRFAVWAPRARKVAVRLEDDPVRTVALAHAGDGLYTGTVDGVGHGTAYRYRLDGRDALADPASRWQPQGVHGPSAVLDPDHAWTDQHWRGLPWSRYIIYELHVGTFTGSGTFEGVIERLDELAELGVTALELMPVAEFPGARNWGYDGVFPFAAQSTYGGPEALRRLVDACHARGLAVVLDVVYNHLGPEGNVLARYGPYFTDYYRTPWGEAMNFDGPESDQVRRYFIDNALHWIRDFHIDALRLDAVHAIYDNSAYTFLEALADAVHREAEHLNRCVHLVAESDLNNPLLSTERRLGGAGLDGQWNDDFHHALHAWITGERTGYYVDFGDAAQLARAMAGGFVYAGQYSPYRRRRHGTPRRKPEPSRLVVFGQNHDQVGNRPRGERLASLVDFETLKLVAGVVLLSPSVPLLFMGEEWAATEPFPYFVDHGDAALMEAVRDGRARELAGFGWTDEPLDPTAAETFDKATLPPAAAASAGQKTLRSFYRAVIEQRRRMQAEAPLDGPWSGGWSIAAGPLIGFGHGDQGTGTVVLHHIGRAPVELEVPLDAGGWRRVLDSADAVWRGPGSLAPEALQSSGCSRLSFQPASVMVWVRDTASRGINGSH